MKQNEMKMVCVMRSDLRNSDGHKLPKGKLVAQGGHAFVALVLQMQDKEKLQKWLDFSFVKVCLRVNSEEELLALHKKAKEKELNTVLIKDNGMTQFDGKPTNTCVGIGPDCSPVIDELTGELKSL